MKTRYTPPSVVDSVTLTAIHMHTSVSIVYSATPDAQSIPEPRHVRATTCQRTIRRSLTNSLVQITQYSYKDPTRTGLLTRNLALFSMQRRVSAQAHSLSAYPHGATRCRTAFYHPRLRRGSLCPFSPRPDGSWENQPLQLNLHAALPVRRELRGVCQMVLVSILALGPGPL